MNSTATTDEVSLRCLAQAAAWRAHLTEIGADSTVAFEEWMAADARNEAAWRQVQAPWELFAERAASPELIEARRVALARAQASRRTQWRKRATSTKWIAGVASLIVVTVGIAIGFARPESYRTDLGERRVVTLSDGSRISLDSQSEVRARYSQTARELTLIRGQARFDVAHEAGRPFIVLAQDRKIVATGTAFNVDLLGTQLRVTLIEGSIVVLELAPPEPGEIRNGRALRTFELSAGEQLVVSPSIAPQIETADVEREIAWQDGQLIFENETLAVVAARVSRYASHPLVVSDAQAAAVRISGVFKTGDLDGFIDTVTSYLPVRAERQSNGTVSLHYGLPPD